MNTPPDLNDVLWQLAESQDPKQIDAFLAQHPELKSELKARMGMISGIKGAKPVQKKVTAERFLPSPKALSSDPPRWAAALAATVLMGGAVFATVGTLKYVESKNTQKPALTPGQVKPNLTSERDNPTTQDDGTSAVNGPPIGTTYTPEDPNQVQPEKATRAIDLPVTIVARQISLSSALNDIGIQAGIKLNSAPGMPNPTITLDFRDVPALEVLNALGAKLGFTPIIETTNSINLIPARDPNAPDPGALPGFVNPSNPEDDGNSGLQPLGNQDSGINRAFQPTNTNN